MAIDDWRSENRAETYTRPGTGTPASNYKTSFYADIELNKDYDETVLWKQRVFSHDFEFSQLQRVFI